MSKSKEVRNTLSIATMNYVAYNTFKKYAEDNDNIVSLDSELIGHENDIKSDIGYDDVKKRYNDAVQSNTITDSLIAEWNKVSNEYDTRIAEFNKKHNEDVKPYRKDMTKLAKILRSDKKDSLFNSVYETYVTYKHAYTNQQSAEFSQYVKAWATLAQARLGVKDAKGMREVVKRMDAVIGMRKNSTRSQAKKGVGAIDVWSESDYVVMAMNCLYQLQTKGNIQHEEVEGTVEA